MTMTVVFLAASILAPAADPSASHAESKVSLGVNSCTASACHGGPAGVKGKEWNSSYTVWATKDPHADAFETLYSERSKNIVARLAVSENEDPKKDPKQYRAFLERRCVACHATVGQDRHSPDGYAEDGVSCASCHGVAGEWLGNEHAGRRSNKAGGMTNTKDLVPRAKVCVDCHVGSPARNGQPGRDVNHDLIAAGHPRLNFEFAAYLGTLPAHWNVDKDRDRVRQPSGAKKPQGNFAAEAWATGQFVAANAALELLESRAATDGRSDKDHAWPEFSEISCYSCHHDLRSPSYRQKLFQREAPTDRRSPIGSLVWGTWYSPMPRRFLLAQPGGAANNEAGWNELERVMSVLQPDSKEVVRLSTALRQKLTLPVNSQQTVERLTKSKPAPRSDWDEVAQWYLAAVAWHQALQEEHEGNQKPGDQAKIKEREEALRESQTTLEKLRGQIESPLDFDPTSEAFQHAVDQLLLQLAKLKG